MSGPDLKETIKEKYGQAALQVVQGGRANCGPTAQGKTILSPPIFTRQMRLWGFPAKP